MSRLMRFSLWLLAAAIVCALAFLVGGTWGPCGPASPVGLFGLLGMFLFSPLSVILLLICAIRALFQKRSPKPVA